MGQPHSIDNGEPTLTAMLAARARASSDRRLALDAGIGLVAAVGVIVTRPPVWPPLALLALALGAYGAWGIVDRELAERRASGAGARGLRLARDGLGAIGVAAAIGAGLLLFFGALGTWIS